MISHSIRELGRAASKGKACRSVSDNRRCALIASRSAAPPPKGMSPPRLVIFDMDDVLCRYELGRRLRALAAISEKSPRDIRAAIWDSGFEDESDAGGYPKSEDYLAEFANRLGHSLSKEQWIAARK